MHARRRAKVLWFESKHYKIYGPTRTTLVIAGNSEILQDKIIRYWYQVQEVVVEEGGGKVVGQEEDRRALMSQDTIDVTRHIDFILT